MSSPPSAIQYPIGKCKRCLRENVEIVSHGLCWDCDWDLANGGDEDEDAGEIYIRRWEEEYEYDPINTPLPPGWKSW